MLSGPSIDRFGANKIMLTFLALYTFVELGVFIFYPGIFTLTMVLFAMAWFCWLQSVKVAFYQNGIEYKSIFGKKEILWEDLKYLYYSVLKERVGFSSDFATPVGTYYRFTLETLNGGKLAFGNRFERPADVGNRLLRDTHEVLYQRELGLFDGGSELDFGPIQLSRVVGIKIKKLFRTTTIPIGSIFDYRIKDGRFYVWGANQKRSRGTPIRKIPNVFVLVGILDTVSTAHKRIQSGI